MPPLVVLGNPPSFRSSDPLKDGPVPRIHALPGEPPLVFVVEGSRLFEVDPELFAALSRGDEEAQADLLAACAHIPSSTTGDAPLPLPNAISLNIAQSCNLSCSYCYADEGRFGGRAVMMSHEVARAAIDQLFDGTPERRVTVGFIGGEPFLNREVLYSAVDYAAKRARDTGSTVGFSVTTNGTLLTPQDLDFLREHSFAVSVSLDGSAEVNDRNRRARNRDVSGFGLAMRALEPLLRNPSNTRIACRATVTRDDLRVAERIDALARYGFAEIGVSPLRTGPRPGLTLRDEDWPVFLTQMVRAAEAEWVQVRKTGTFRFANLAIALKQLHVGYCKPLPCGSAATYVSVSALGQYFTCHRTIDDPRFGLGSTADGLSADDRVRFLRSRHVDMQEPCRYCWARYLCGGGCHAEVLQAGRRGCDYIRGWLEYCLRFYDKVLRERPGLLERGEYIR